MAEQTMSSLILVAERTEPFAEPDGETGYWHSETQVVRDCLVTGELADGVRRAFGVDDSDAEVTFTERDFEAGYSDVTNDHMFEMVVRCAGKSKVFSDGWPGSLTSNFIQFLAWLDKSAAAEARAKYLEAHPESAATEANDAKRLSQWLRSVGYLQAELIREWREVPISGAELLTPDGVTVTLLAWFDDGRVNYSATLSRGESTADISPRAAGEVPPRLDVLTAALRQDTLTA